MLAATSEIVTALKGAEFDVLIDDRDQRPGFKFKDADLIGIPLRVVIGERGLKDGNIEVKWRHEAAAHTVPAEDAGRAIVGELREAMAKLAEEAEARKLKRAGAIAK